MSLSLNLLRSPYDSVLHPVAFHDLCNKLADAGTLLVFRIDNIDADAETLKATAAGVRRIHHGIPFVLWPACNRHADVLDAAARARLFGIRAVIAGPFSDPDSLRKQLTHTSDLKDHVLLWLRQTGHTTRSETLGFLARVFAAARKYRTVNGVARILGVSPRALAKGFAVRSLPPPKRFVKLLAYIEDSLAIQSLFHIPLQNVAVARGYTDGKELRKVMKRAFGTTPTRIREMLGPEPLLARWVEKHHKSRTRGSQISAHTQAG